MWYSRLKGSSCDAVGTEYGAFGAWCDAAGYS